jgi:hypothetical protein
MDEDFFGLICQIGVISDVKIRGLAMSRRFLNRASIIARGVPPMIL